jgi:hypothetical protein
MTPNASHQTQGVVSLALVGVGNAGSWLVNTNYGMAAAGITAVGTAIGGVAIYFRREWVKVGTEGWADKRRLEIQLQAEQDKVDENSLRGQVAKLLQIQEELRDDLRETKDDLKETRSELAMERGEVRSLRDENRSLLSRLTLGQIHQGAEIRENRAAIRELKAEQSGPMPVVGADEGGATTG